MHCVRPVTEASKWEVGKKTGGEVRDGEQARMRGRGGDTDEGRGFTSFTSHLFTWKAHVYTKRNTVQSRTGAQLCLCMEYFMERMRLCQLLLKETKNTTTISSVQLVLNSITALSFFTCSCSSSNTLKHTLKMLGGA